MAAAGTQPQVVGSLPLQQLSWGQARSTTASLERLHHGSILRAEGIEIGNIHHWRNTNSAGTDLKVTVTYMLWTSTVVCRRWWDVFWDVCWSYEHSHQKLPLTALVIAWCKVAHKLPCTSGTICSFAVFCLVFLSTGQHLNSRQSSHIPKRAAGPGSATHSSSFQQPFHFRNHWKKEIIANGRVGCLQKIYKPESPR